MKYLIVPVFFFLASSCSFSVLSGDKDLGGGYFIWVEGEDGSSNSIIKSENGSAMGLEVIPPTVLKVGYNESTIIVSSRESPRGSHSFWIINKNIPVDMEACIDQATCDSVLQSNVEGPMDSIHFYRLKKEKKIQLDFK